MVKQEFLDAIREPLKAEGYRKKGFYWYKKANDLVFCINLQGSQWNKDDYYFQIGAALYKEDSETPTILGWLFRHRCKGEHGELNVSPQEALTCVVSTFGELKSSAQLSDFLQVHNATKVANQYWF